MGQFYIGERVRMINRDFKTRCGKTGKVVGTHSNTGELMYDVLLEGDFEASAWSVGSLESLEAKTTALLEWLKDET